MTKDGPEWGWNFSSNQFGFPDLKEGKSNIYIFVFVLYLYKLLQQMLDQDQVLLALSWTFFDKRLLHKPKKKKGGRLTLLSNVKV